MAILSRNVWHPLGRAAVKPAPATEPAYQGTPRLERVCAGGCDCGRLPCPHPELCPLQAAEPAEFDEEAEPDAWDEADELAAMSDADFYRQLRADVEGVRAGTVPSIAAAQRPSPKDRLRSRRYKRRDRYGKAF
jgi:hypothetical protein